MLNISAEPRSKNCASRLPGLFFTTRWKLRLLASSPLGHLSLLWAIIFYLKTCCDSTMRNGGGPDFGRFVFFKQFGDFIHRAARGHDIVNQKKFLVSY